MSAHAAGLVFISVIAFAVIAGGADLIEGAVYRWIDRRRADRRRDLIADAHREHRTPPL